MFSVVTLTYAKNKLETVKNNYENEKIEMSIDLEIKNFVDFYQNLNLETLTIAGCSSLGNAYYDTLIADGFTHREARAYRRVIVRDCRGNGPNGWLGITFQVLPSGVTF